MIFSESYKFSDVWSNFFSGIEHGWYGIGLPLQSNTLTHYSSPFHRSTGSSTTVPSCRVAPKDKNIIIFKGGYYFRGYPYRLFNLLFLEFSNCKLITCRVKKHSILGLIIRQR